MTDNAVETTTDATPMVSVRGVHKFFGDLHVLRGIDLDIAPGEVCVILGPSGSGKSTLLRCLNLLEKISAGRVYVDGELLGYREYAGGALSERHDKEIAAQRSRIGMVFQRFNLFPHMTALENVMEAPVQVLKRSKKEARAQALELLERVGLADRADHYPAELSGGQQQRVAIARALAMDPDIMLFDEPTSALDTTVQKQVLEELLMLRDTLHTAMIIITHNIGVARHLADRVAVLYKGEIVEMGKTKEVLENPQHPYTKSLMAAVPKLAYAMEKEA